MSNIINCIVYFLVVVNCFCFLTEAVHRLDNNNNSNDFDGFIDNDDNTTFVAIDGLINAANHHDWANVFDNSQSDYGEKVEVEQELPSQRGRGSRMLRKHLRFMRQRANRQNEERQLRKSIKFIYYKKNDYTHESIDEGAGEAEQIGDCQITDKFAFILHGWRQSCDIEWMPKLIERLSKYRGGCIVCIDYSSFAKESYMWLYRHFKLISQLITLRFYKLIDQGFDPSKGYMFGFSYGGQLATTVGQVVAANYKYLKSIDTCDMAGPGFDLGSQLIDHRGAAENVQCLHSSRDKGTRIYACHQNVRLGNCGFNQPAAASQATYSSHGLCVQIYINAFDYPFYALSDKPPWCISYNPAENLPQPFTIGYKENHNPNITGEIFVPTGLYFPYNLPELDVNNDDDYPSTVVQVMPRPRPLQQSRKRSQITVKLLKLRP